MSEMIRTEIENHGITINDDAQMLASNCHTELTAITVVNSPATQLTAVAAGSTAQKFLKDLEASRKTVKAPVLELSRKIDALADELASPVQAEMKRVGTLVAKYQTAEAQRVAREQRERDERERKAMEDARLAQERERQAAATMTTEADLEAAIKAESEAKALEATMYRELTKPMPVANKASGSITKSVLRYEVTDMKAAYAAAPHLFSLEIKPSAVNSTCNANTVIPGMRFWEELKSSFRAS